MSTIAERAHMGRVAELGCVICQMLGLGPTPAEIHHQRTGTGAGMRGKGLIPLCPEHHRGNAGLHGMGRKAFERKYGVTELDLIEQTRKQING